jgi:hypothetical protein
VNQRHSRRRISLSRRRVRSELSRYHFWLLSRKEVFLTELRVPLLRIPPSSYEGKSASTETESQHVLRLLFSPSQCEQSPQCVSNPESTVTELDSCCLRKAASTFASWENLHDDPFLHFPWQPAFTTEGVEDGVEDGREEDATFEDGR